MDAPFIEAIQLNDGIKVIPLLRLLAVTGEFLRFKGCICGKAAKITVKMLGLAVLENGERRARFNDHSQLTRVNTLAISERNKRCKDVLYGIVTRNTHEHSTSFKQIFSGRISESLEKGKYRCYTLFAGKSIGGLARIYFFKLELIRAATRMGSFLGIKLNIETR